MEPCPVNKKTQVKKRKSRQAVFVFELEIRMEDSMEFMGIGAEITSVAEGILGHGFIL